MACGPCWDVAVGWGMREGGTGEEGALTAVFVEGTLDDVLFFPVGTLFTVPSGTETPVVLFGPPSVVGVALVWCWGELCCFTLFWGRGILEGEMGFSCVAGVPGVGDKGSSLLGKPTEGCFTDLVSSVGCSCVGCVDGAAGLGISFSVGGFCTGAGLGASWLSSS